MVQSLKWRITVSVVLVLAGLFSGLAYFANQSVESAMEISFREDLTGRLYGLLASAQWNEAQQQLHWDDRSIDPVFNRPDSGYSAVLLNGADEMLWERNGALSPGCAVSRGALGQLRWAIASSHYCAAMTIEWSEGDQVSGPWTLLVQGDQSILLGPIDGFQSNLLWGLFYIGIVLTVVIFGLMHWQWLPAKAMERELAALETGEQNTIVGQYPYELSGLVQRLNAYIGHNQFQTRTTKQYLENLAHTLKTPLAALRGGAALSQVDTQLVAEQVERMDQAVRLAVQRAHVANRSLVIKPIGLHGIVARMVLPLEKAWADRPFTIENTVDESAAWMMEESDGFELFGNLLDNAIKYGATHIHVHQWDGAIVMDDNGPGIAPSYRQSVLDRGVRVDERYDGQGIGLAMVRSMMEAYGGSIELADSPAGGLRVILRLPFTFV